MESSYLPNDWWFNSELVAINEELSFDPFPCPKLFPDSSFFTDPLPVLLDIEPTQDGYENGNRFWDELGLLLQPCNNNQMLLNEKDHCINGDHEVMLKKKDRVSSGNKRSRKERYRNKKNRAKLVSWEAISQYFYIPITRVAKELNVGLTILKKRCREFGIRRWPNRKLRSIQNLINNLKALEGEANVSEEIELLERERKMLEGMPNIDMRRSTQRLRQAFFKANYKKKKYLKVADLYK